MERLTNTAWRNFDPWECCGQDNFCTRGCHEKGGCNNGCIVPKLYGRLAAYEDFMDRWHLKSIEDAERIFRRVNDLGGTDLMAQYRELGSINHLRDLLQAEKAGRLVVLPCKVVDTIDKLFSHNEIIALWYDKPGDKDHSYLLWRGEAWRLPDKYKGQMVLKFKGVIPEKISEADTINLQITPCEDTALAGKGGAR